MAWPVVAQPLETKPADTYFDKFQIVKAPGPRGLLLKKGDRLAICGDSITEVDGAVAAKQEYETRQIKTLFHGPEAKTEMAAVERLTERTRAPLVAAVKKAFVPVTHTLEIRPE